MTIPLLSFFLVSLGIVLVVAAVVMQLRLKPRKSAAPVYTQGQATGIDSNQTIPLDAYYQEQLTGIDVNRTIPLDIDHGRREQAVLVLQAQDS